MKMKTCLTTTFLVAAVFAAVLPRAAGESVSYTPAAGYFALPLKAGSDNYVSLPLVPKAAGFGTVSAAGRDRVTIGSGRWNAGQFRAKPGAPRASYVAEFVTGPLRGISYDVLDNNSDTLLLDMQGDDLTQHPRGSVGFGDVVRLRPLWTPAAVFGDAEANLQIAPKANASASGDTVILPDNLNTGLNKPPAAQLSFIQNAGWRSAGGDQSANRADYPLVPGQPMNIRRMAPQDTAVITLGHVARGPQAVYVPDGGLGGNDSLVALLHPEPVVLQDSALMETTPSVSGAFSSSSNAIFRADELMSFEGGTGTNQTPERAFYYLAGRGWREAGAPGMSAGQSLTLEPGRAYLIRKKPGSPGGDWMQQGQIPTSP